MKPIKPKLNTSMADKSQESTSVQLEQEKGQKSIQLSPAGVGGQPVNQTRARRDCEKQTCLSVCLKEQQRSQTVCEGLCWFCATEKKKITARLQTETTVCKNKPTNKWLSVSIDDFRVTASWERDILDAQVNPCATSSHLSVFFLTRS